MCAHIGLGLHQENHATHTQSPIMPHVEVTNYKQHVAGNSKQHMGKQSGLTHTNTGYIHSGEEDW